MIGKLNTLKDKNGHYSVEFSQFDLEQLPKPLQKDIEHILTNSKSDDMALAIVIFALSLWQHNALYNLDDFVGILAKAGLVAPFEAETVLDYSKKAERPDPLGMPAESGYASGANAVGGMRGTFAVEGGNITWQP